MNTNFWEAEIVEANGEVERYKKNKKTENE